MVSNTSCWIASSLVEHCVWSAVRVYDDAVDSVYSVLYDSLSDAESMSSPLLVVACRAADDDGAHGIDDDDASRVVVERGVRVLAVDVASVLKLA